MSDPDPDRIPRAIQRAWDNAKLAPVDHGPIPLGALIESFRLVHYEIAGLSQTSAAEFLRARTVEIDVPADTTPLAGFIAVNGDGVGVIMVRAGDNVARRRFTAAHELGHYLLHFTHPLFETEVWSKSDRPDTIRDEDSASSEQREVEANRFAAELLLPESGCRATVARLTRQHKLLSARYLEHAMSSEWIVSLEAARWRLRALNLPTIGK